LIDEQIFLKHFPTSSGVHVLLINAEGQDAAPLAEELRRAFRNSGLDLTYTADRLAEFNTVENTYLSIFLLLGGLGMILGTIGLGLSLARNILDRQRELAILRAVGFRKRSVLNMLAREHIILLGTGTLIGALCAFVATAPSVFSAFVDASWQTALLIIALIFLNGLAWIYFIGKSSLRTNLVVSLRSE
jgi:ABC-type antimicrobial peptide transport system permease subunit